MFFHHRQVAIWVDPWTCHRFKFSVLSVPRLYFKFQRRQSRQTVNTFPSFSSPLVLLTFVHIATPGQPPPNPLPEPIPRDHSELFRERTLSLSPFAMGYFCNFDRAKFVWNQHRWHLDRDKSQKEPSYLSDCQISSCKFCGRTVVWILLKISGGFLKDVKRIFKKFLKEPVHRSTVKK